MASEERSTAGWFSDNWDTIRNLPTYILRLLHETEDQDGQRSQPCNNPGNITMPEILEACKKENQQLRDNLKELKQTLENERKHREKREARFKELYEEKNQQVESYKERLAVASEKRVRSDQRKVEDTLSRSRQSWVENDYSGLRDGKRVDAIQTLEKWESSRYLSPFKKFTRVDQNLRFHRLACKVLEVAYETALKVKESFLQDALTLLDSLPDQALKMGLDRFNNKFGWFMGKIAFELPSRQAATAQAQRQDLKDSVLLALKENTTPRGMEDLSQVVLRSINAKCREDSKLLLYDFENASISKIDDYVKECTKLSWILVTQVPPLALEFKEPLYYPELCTAKEEKVSRSTGLVVSGPQRQKASHSTCDPRCTKEQVYCYLWPALIDADRKVIKKGEVVLCS